MLIKISFKRLLFLFSVAVLIFFFIIIFWLIFSPLPNSLPNQSYFVESPLVFNSPPSQNTLNIKIAEPTPKIVSIEPTIPGLSMRLIIPTINVDTNLEAVGLTSQGAVDVPKDPAKAAWFNLGPLPGSSGSAVITGHYGRWKNGKDSVFDNLYKLRPGDKLSVVDDKGFIISFVVRESRRYDSADSVPEVFASDDGKSHLNLITCEGVWDEQAKQYPQRLVVFTDKEY